MTLIVLRRADQFQSAAQRCDARVSMNLAPASAWKPAVATGGEKKLTVALRSQQRAA